MCSMLAPAYSLPTLFALDANIQKSRTEIEPLFRSTMGKHPDAEGMCAYLLDDPALRGRLIETAVGAHLLARSQIEHFDLFWWRDGNEEVDFVAAQGDDVVAIEVKSGRVKRLGGLVAFQNRFPAARKLVIGSASCPLNEFLRGKVRIFA